MGLTCLPKMDCSENQDFAAKGNQFKNQLGQLLDTFRLFPFNDQLKLLSEVRRFFLEVENICNAVNHDDKLLDSRLLPIGSYHDDISTPLQRNKTTTATDDVEEEEVQVDAATTLKETDIRQIADYLLGFSKLTDGNNSDDQIIINPDSTSLLELSPCVRRPTVETRTETAAMSSETTQVRLQEDDEVDQRVELSGARVNLRPRPARRRIDETTSPPLKSSMRNRLKTRSTEECSTLGILSCARCRSQFESVEQLDKHPCVRSRNALHRHERTARRLYECDRCERKFVKRPSLFAHQREHAHPNEVVCLKCGVTSADAEQHAVHVQRHAERAPFRCNTCGESFARRQQYDRHTTGHRLYDCADCSDHVAHFTTKKQVARHRRLVHGIHSEEKRHECSICQKTFIRRRQLEIHQRRSHFDDGLIRAPTKCSLCLKSFRTPSALAKHLKNSTAHQTNTSAAETPIAVTIFASTEEQVQAVVAKVRRRQAASGDDLGDGGRRHHGIRQTNKTVSMRKEDNVPGYLCSVCGATFLRKQCLVRHNRQQHDGGILYECDFCEYSCKCKANLKRHVELHVNERRRFVCELCAASFHALGTLKEHHAYVHCDERRYACSECGKAFKAKSALQRHARVHNDRRPYVCTQCTQSYKRMSHLKRHMATVHGAVFESKRVRRLRGERMTSSPEPPPPESPPDPSSSSTFDDQQLSRVTACDMVNNNFLMIDTDAAVATDVQATQLPVGQCLQPLPPMADIAANGRLLRHHAFLDVDYHPSTASNVLQPIDVLQSDLATGTTINSGSVDGGKISDIFW